MAFARSISIHLLNDNGSYRCELPDYKSLTIMRETAGPGSISFDYEVKGTNFAALREFVDNESQAKVVVRVNGSVDFYELIGQLEDAKTDDVDPNGIWSFGGHWVEKRLEGAVLYPVAEAENGETNYAAATPGELILHALGIMQDRSTLTDILTTTFDGDTDSAGDAWPNTISVKFSPGTSLKAVLDELRDQGFIEYTISRDMELRLYIPENWGVDRTLTTPPVIFTTAENITSSPRKYSALDMATHLLVVGADGLNTTYPNADALAKIGHRIEKYISVGNINSQGSLDAYGQLQATLIGDPQLEVTHELNLQGDVPMPIEDFDLGDWIWSDTPHSEAKQRLQTVQFTITGDDANTLTGSISLNSRFFTDTLKLKRRLERMLNGSVVVGTSEVPPAGSEEPDTTIPKPPTGLNAESIAYHAAENTDTLAEVTATWVAPTENTDNSALTDLAGYRLRYSYLGRSQVGGIPSSNPDDLPVTWTYLDVGGDQLITDETATFDGVSGGTDIGFQVAAVDNSGNNSAWSTRFDLTVESDDTPPPKPSDPIVTTWFRTLNIGWNGLTDAGAEMLTAAPDFDYIGVYISQVSGFTPSDVTLRATIFAPDSQTNVVMEGYATTYYVRFIAYDRSGNPSVVSDQTSGVTVRALLDDITDEVITAAKLADDQPLGPKISSEQISTPHLTVATFSDSLIPNGTFEDVPLDTASTLPAMWALGTNAGTGTKTFTRHTTATNVFSGAASAQFTLTVASGTLQAVSETIPVKPGDALYVELTAKASRALNGLSVSVLVGATDPPTNLVAISGGQVALTTAFVKKEYNYAVPALVGGVAPKYLKLVITGGGTVGDAASVNMWIDEVRVRKVVGTAEIADASIIRAKIGLLAVGEANIEFVNAGSITAGTMTATITNAGLFRTATSGNRVEFDSSGIRLYQSTTVVGNWKTSDASILMTGTYQSALSGERINILPDGSMRFYPAAGSNYSQLTNFGNDLMLRGIQDSNSRSGRININQLGAGMNFSAESEIPNLLLSEVAVFDRFAKVVAPWIQFQVNGRYAPADGSFRRLQFTQSNSSGVILAQSVLEYKLDTGGNPAMVAIQENAGWKAEDGIMCVVNAALNSFMEIKASAHTIGSSETIKDNIEDVRSVLDPLEVIQNAPAVKYNYIDEMTYQPPPTDEDPNPTPIPVENPPLRIGVIAEQLPTELVHDSPNADGTPGKSINLGEMIGLAWGAIWQLRNQQIRTIAGRLIVTTTISFTQGSTREVTIPWDEEPLEVPLGGVVMVYSSLGGKVAARIKQGSMTKQGCVVQAQALTNITINATNPLIIEAQAIYNYLPPYVPPTP